MSENHKLVVSFMIIINRNIHTNDIVSIHEDGFITKVTITKKEIKYTWMEDGMDSDRVWRNG